MTSTEDQRGRTISEKILARASEQKDASAGEIVKARVDVAMMPDLTTILSVKAMKAMGRKKVWDNTKIVPILDHVAEGDAMDLAALVGLVLKYGLPSNCLCGEGPAREGLRRYRGEHKQPTPDELQQEEEQRMRGQREWQRKEEEHEEDEEHRKE